MSRLTAPSDYDYESEGMHDGPHTYCERCGARIDVQRGEQLPIKPWCQDCIYEIRESRERTHA